MKPTDRRTESLVLLAAATAAYSLIGWRTNLALAGIIAPVLLLRFARTRRRGAGILALLPFLAAGSSLAMVGGWDIDPWMLPFFGVVRSLPVLAALGLDRFARARLGPVVAGLAFPASLTALDWLLSMTPLATVLSPAVGLFGLRELAQVASVAGIWGLGFLVWWSATAVNAAWEAGWRLRDAGPALALPLAFLALGLGYGAARIAGDGLGAPSVRVAGVSVPHPRDYWNIIDDGTPRDAAIAVRAETAALQDRLFDGSARGAAAGARFIVWSEGACVLDEETEPAFVERAGAFAADRGVYLAAAVLTLRFGSGISDNKILMFTPAGGLAFTYVKTISWYPTGSDGTVHVVDTPWGRVGAAICFDMDTPSFARKLASLGADIVLVPAFDTERISPFHTEVGLFRAVENGYSIFRQVAHGTSMAVDGTGVVRALQDFGAVEDRLMIADLPTRGRPAAARYLGDLPAWACAAGTLVLVAAGLSRGRRRDGA